MPRRGLYPLLPAPAKREPRVNAARFLSGTSLLRGLDSALNKRLAAAGVVRRFAKGEFVCHAGAPAKDIWVLLEGRVCVHRPSFRGTRVNLEIMLPGDAFGLPALTLWSYPSDIQATKASAALAIPRASLLREMKGDQKLSERVLTVISERLHYIESQLALAHEPVETRLAAALVYLAHKFGAVLPLTSAEIGEMAQTTPATAMRKLKVFEKEGLLRRRRGRVEIADRRALEARVGG